MRTLGIDLAAQGKKTAWCAIKWAQGRATVEPPVVGASDEDLLGAMRAADWIGIDAPFGWPDPMVEAIHRYSTEGAWPTDAAPGRLRHRTTDRSVHKTIAEKRGQSVWPLSVSSDRIAVCAWRCAKLLGEFGEATGRHLDRIGVPAADTPEAPSGPPPPGTVVEVYPAGALAMWGYPFKGYKRTAARSAAEAFEKRSAILAILEEECGDWLSLDDEVRTACLRDDDSFDSFLCSLVARAAATNRTIHPAPDQRTIAGREGWIHLPARDSIAKLGS